MIISTKYEGVVIIYRVVGGGWCEGRVVNFNNCSREGLWKILACA